MWTLNRMITLSKLPFPLASVFSLNDWILSWKSRLKTTSVPPGPLISWTSASSHKLLAVESMLTEPCHPPQWSFFSWVFDPLVSVFSWLSDSFLQDVMFLSISIVSSGQAGGRLGSTCCAGEQVLSLLFSSSFTNLYPEDLISQNCYFLLGMLCHMETSRHADRSWLQLLDLFFKRWDQLNEGGLQQKEKRKP